MNVEINPGIIETLIPYVIPFLIGLIVGLLVRTMLKLAVSILALAVLLSWGGYAGFPSVKELFQRAEATLPKIFGEGKGLLNSLPITAPAFVLGLVIGIWWSG